MTQSSAHWLVNAVSTDAPEAADILRCESSRCHSRVVLLAPLREAVHGGSYAQPQTTRKHGCTMCTMRIHLFDNGMSDVQSLHANHNELLHLLQDVSWHNLKTFGSYPSKALQWCSSLLSESSDTSGCRNSFEVHACKDVDLCTTIEPSNRAHRNDDTSNKKKSQFTKTCQCRRREHHREKLETYHILTTQLPH